MPLSIEELASAREVVAFLLDELGLEAYLFDVEPGEHDWVVAVECATDAAWQRVSLPLDREMVRQCEQPGPARQHILRQWAERLGACRRR